MKCRIFNSYISSYIDGELSSNMVKRLTSHLEQCGQCNYKYRELLAVRSELAKLDQYELSSSFKQKLHSKLVEEESSVERKKLYSRLLIGVGLLAVIIIFISVNGLGFKSANYSETQEMKADMESHDEAMDTAPTAVAGEEKQEDGDYGEESAEEIGEMDTDSTSMIGAERKLIKSGHLIVETLDFDSTVSGILAKTNMLQGYVETSTIEGASRYRNDKSKRHASFDIRIPSKNFEKFMEAIGDIGDVTHKEVYGEDVTAQYFDTEARLKSLKVQEERLLTILSKAEKLQDIIELERELSKVRYEIENYTGTLKKWDNLIDYSSVHISIREVEQLQLQLEGSFAERVSKGFMRSIRNLGNFFENVLAAIIIGSPYILIIGVLVWLIKVIFIDKRIK